MRRRMKPGGWIDTYTVYEIRTTDDCVECVDRCVAVTEKEKGLRVCRIN